MARSDMIVCLGLALAMCAAASGSSLAQQTDKRGYLIPAPEVSRNETFDGMFQPRVPTFNPGPPAVPNAKLAAPAPSFLDDPPQAPGTPFSTGDTTSSYSTDQGSTTGDTTSSYSTLPPTGAPLR